MNTPVPICTEESFLRRENLDTPAIVRGCDIGPCVELWKDPEYLANSVPEDRRVTVHLTNQPGFMDFKAKNFEYCVMDFRTLIRKAASFGPQKEAKSYYLRSTGTKDSPRGRVLFEEDFPDLSRDFSVPERLYPPRDKLFSSVLRVSSPGIRVWTHYDVPDNIYVQIVGRKKAVLWAPDQALNLYLDGSDKSRVIDIDNPDVDKYPKFLDAPRWVGNLEPGDILYIPALWFHNMEALDFGVAVNLFWKNLDDKIYDKKDAYGNRDPLPAAKASRMLDNVMKQLDELPDTYKDFYARQLIARIEKKCLIHPL